MEREQSIDYLIRSTWISIAKMYSEKAAEYGATMVMAFSLLSIDPKNGTQSTALGPKMGLEPTSLTRTLKKLEEEKLIKKTPNPEDGRSVIIHLTPLGLEMRDISKKTVLAFQNDIEQVLEPKEIEQLKESLLKIYNLTTNLSSKTKNEETY